MREGPLVCISILLLERRWNKQPAFSLTEGHEAGPRKRRPRTGLITGNYYLPGSLQCKRENHWRFRFDSKLQIPAPLRTIPSAVKDFRYTCTDRRTNWRREFHILPHMHATYLTTFSALCMEEVQLVHYKQLEFPYWLRHSLKPYNLRFIISSLGAGFRRLNLFVPCMIRSIMFSVTEGQIFSINLCPLRMPASRNNSSSPSESIPHWEERREAGASYSGIGPSLPPGFVPQIDANGDVYGEGSSRQAATDNLHPDFSLPGGIVLRVSRVAFESTI